MTDMKLVCSLCMSNSETLVNIFTEKLTDQGPLLLDIIKECFNFQRIDDNKHPKNICECCVLELRTANRFKRNYERFIKLEENEADDFIDSLAAENWELVRDFVKQEHDDSSDEDGSKENDQLSETTEDSNKGNIGDEVVTELRKNNKKCKTHICNVCNKGFSRKPNLRLHLRVHTGEKPYKCLHCHKSFTQTSSLKTHQRVHTGERKFKCSHCPKDFTRKHNLLRHAAKHAPCKSIRPVT